jgi:hypothetical protein
MVTQRSGPQGKHGEKWLRDLTPDNATAPAPDPTSGSWPARCRRPDSLSTVQPSGTGTPSGHMTPVRSAPAKVALPGSRWPARPPQSRHRPSTSSTATNSATSCATSRSASESSPKSMRAGSIALTRSRHPSTGRRGSGRARCRPGLGRDIELAALAEQLKTGGIGLKFLVGELLGSHDPSGIVFNVLPAYCPFQAYLVCPRHRG